ncbi:MAG: hypothetical protein E6F98_11265 [Actinobacteria bacterium]|nr:MAG: hypothetical protein E6F98_11265 [Actinomycetota bacterium]
MERIERARRGGRLGGRHGGANDDVALVEGDAQRRDLVLAQLVLVGERLELPLLDEAALGGLLEQALGRRQIVQMRVSQWDRPLSFSRGAAPSQARRPRRGAWPAIAGRPLFATYRTAWRACPFPNIAFLRFPNNGS